ncbi:gamma-glutamyltransferase [Mucisphaera calidilacus]|uniref:Glutathione hydrolase proenzyme n=1 Tax=Mucisphaera calidilacus TaxID=2527982 RepID=A0A518BTP4_9BACT|nr:gamma-glutamyltransferase [Mucisphaera calidilacus]QDU70335.1 Gamma-glutamyltranspeptidase precursor [Mucisphaera calidilacus]
MKRVLLTLCLLALCACTATQPTEPQPAPTKTQPEAATKAQVTTSTTGMVASNSDVASRIGADVLRQGGNAVDAAIATQFALAVTWPEAGNIGGGGFMLVAPPHKEVVCIDYRETAPLDATTDMYTFGENRHHHRHAGVPGTVAGMEQAHHKFGSLEWADLVTPAVELARNGFTVDEHLAGSLNSVLKKEKTQTADNLAELRRVYGKPDGTDWQAGDRLQLPDLANTLETIAHQGSKGFYQGKVAQAIADDMKAQGGIITTTDLAGYEARTRKAIHTTYLGHDVYGAPPPSSGGVTITLMLNMLERYDLVADERYSVRTLHLMTEAMKRAFSERAKHLGDTDFVEVPLAELTTKAYARSLAQSINPDKTTPSEELAPPIQLADESPSTTHFSVIDEQGMAVANTTTLEQAWGSRIITPGLGFVYNNEMGDFNWKPGHTDRKGRIGTPANIIEPGKRMLSSMSPTIVRQHGKAILVTGSPGGRTIINTVLGILVSTLDYNQPLAQTIDEPRIHHGWFPDELVVEPGIAESTLQDLRGLGHAVRVRTGPQGAAHSIRIDPKTGTRTGVADHRRGGTAAAP